MNSAVITILSLSVSGSILALILLTGKAMLKNRVSKAFSYYIWILVILRLVLPVSAPVNAMGTLFNLEPPGMNSAPTQQTYIPAGIETERITAPSNTHPVLPEQEDNEAGHSQTPENTRRPLNLWNFFKNNLLWIWLLGAVFSLGWFIAAYLCFSRRIRRSFVPPHSDDLAVFEQMRGSRHIDMACSSLVSTPVLIGVCRPVVVLPQLAYVLSGMGEELKYILRHELTHYRRKDVLYKWLVAAVTSLHWFNPLMFWIRSEISWACELSCDEAVIGGMSESEKQFYGNTLLTFSAGRKLPAGILATTLCEGKEQLKERLITIKHYKKKSTWAALLMLVFAILLTGCAATLGAANSSGSQDWMNAELSLSENGEPRVRYHEQDEWVTLGEPIAAPKEWSSESEIDSRQEAQALSYSPQTSMAMVSADDGWLAATYGNGVANADTYIYRTHDGGKTWNETTQIMEAKWYPNGVLFLDNHYAIVAIGLFVDAPILQTSDGGMTWTQIKLPLDDGVWEAQSLSAEQNVITLTVADRNSDNDGMMETLTSEDGGTTWQREAAAVSTDSDKPAILEAVNDQADAGVEFTNGWRSALVERDENGGKVIIVQVGSLKNDPEQGVAVVCHQTKGSEQYVIDDEFLTPGKHGAIKIESLGAKDFNMSVVAEDGYTWIFNVYNGFYNNGEDGSVSSNSDALSILTENTNFQNHGFVVEAQTDAVKVDRSAAIDKANKSVGEQISTQAQSITAVLAKFTDTETPVLPESNITLKDYPVWIVTYHGVTLQKQGSPDTVYADQNVVIDADSGDVLETFSYQSISNLDWVWPLEERYDTVTAPYGSRFHPITHTTVFHDHIDIGAKEGSSVYTALAGTVSETGFDDEWGNYIVINHDNGIETFYRHLSELQVSAGDSVAAGDAIGTVGSTGNATGPHLAFGVRIDGKTVDPMDYFK